MTSETPEMRVRALVESRPGMSAREMSRVLGLERSEVNAVLYRRKGEWFISTSGSPPRWTLVPKSTPPAHGTYGLVETVIDGDIHVDLPGGDWVLRIQVGAMSINDPIAIVENGGARQRTVTVSHQVSQTEGGTNFTAVLAIAASMLAWEASKEAQVRHPEVRFDFESALRDILLSAAAHVKRQHQSLPS